MKRDHSEGNRDRALEGTPVHPPFQSQAQEIGEDACQKLPLAFASVWEFWHTSYGDAHQNPHWHSAWVWEFWRASPLLSTVPMTDGVARCALESKVPVAF